MSARLISIIGAPASGKTTLASFLTANLPAELIEEDYQGNPFLAESYVGDESSRLASQLYFLMSRARQLSTAAWPGDGLLVSDYGFCQDAIYAKLRLEGDDLAMYQRVARTVDSAVKKPDVLIVLDATVESLLGRISSRGRDFETGMTRDFIEAMRAEHSAGFEDQADSILRIDTDEIDLRQGENCREIMSRLQEKL